MAFFDLNAIDMNMGTTSASVQPKILEKMIELQVQHDLPVNIIVGEKEDELVKVTLEYELIDHDVANWLINKGSQYFCELPPKVILACHD